MKDYSASIIINNYNYASFVNEAINSCLKQTYSNIEIIVVDDGSTDSSASIIESFQTRIIPIFQSNSGQASTLNSGFHASTGDIIFCLDSDDYFTENKVSEIISLYKKYPQIGWCFNTLELMDDETKETIGFSTESNSKICNFREEIKNGYLPFYPPATSGLSFRREVLEQILPMPEEIGNYDRFLCWCGLRLSPGFFLDRPLSIRRVHRENYTKISSQSKYSPIFMNAKTLIRTALFVKQKFPDMAKFCNRKFATGLGVSLWRTSTTSSSRLFIKAYFSHLRFLEKVYIYCLALYQSRPWKKGPELRTTFDTRLASE